MPRFACLLALAALAALAPAQDKPPEDLDYGVYAPYYESKAKRFFKARAAKICSKLSGLNRPCPTCKQQGLVKVVLREGFHDENGVWIPPLEDVRDCPTCRRRKFLFNESVARNFVRSGLAPESRNSRITESALMRRLSESKETYRHKPRMKFEVRGRYAVVRAATRDGIFPLHFHLVPDGEDFEWYLHDPVKQGSFDMAGEFPKIPGRAEITEAYAGDIRRITRRRVVRLAGVTVPGPDGKILDGPQKQPDETLRDLVRKELKGQTVKLEQDSRAEYSCRGVPLVFVEVDGKDYAEDLIRRGLVRRHPKHKSKRSSAYLKAEKEARENRAGVWAVILDEDG